MQYMELDWFSLGIVNYSFYNPLPLGSFSMRPPPEEVRGIIPKEFSLRPGVTL